MSIRSTLLACFTSLAIIAVLIAFIHKNTRYEVVGAQDGIYVLDKRSTLMHHCDKEKCKLLTPDGTDLQTLRTLAGGPDINLVRTPEPPVCVPPAPKIPEQARYVNISSFQSIHDPVPSVSPVIQPQAQVLGMDNVQQFVQKPVNPFPQSAQQMQPITQVAYNPAETFTPMPMGPNMQQPQQAMQAVNTLTEVPQQTLISTNPYTQPTNMETQSQAQPLDNPYGAAASSGQSVSDSYYSQQQPVQALDNPYGAAASGEQTQTQMANDSYYSPQTQ